MRTVAIVLGLCGFLVGLRSAVGGETAEELFEKRIRPIFEEHCLKCHGDQQAKGGLRITSREALLKGGDSGPAVVSEHPDESLLVRATGYLDEPKMPPDAKLGDVELADLRHWVELGAPWPESASVAERSTDEGFHPTPEQQRWWAFQPVADGDPPPVRDVAWGRNAIDRFILAELEAHDMSPAAPAERRVLIRRATFDLTGLPPTPDEVREFLQDRDPDAFSRVVDRLLNSPAYGQRWARRWLDVVRYADFHDGNPAARTASCEPLQAWRYRDWVVAALNRDLPFDEFIVQQIAGDLLPAPEGEECSVDGLVATTFLTNGCWDRGDADKEKMVSDMVDDQIDTVGKAFLGLTLGCARCHDHKFDPIAQTDYYGLAGIFYSTHILADLGAKGAEYTLNRVPLAPPSYLAKRAEQLRQLDELQARLAELDQRTPAAAADAPERTQLIAEREQQQAALLPEPALAEAAGEGGMPGGLFPGIQDVPLHIRGSYTRLGPLVPRHLPAILTGDSRPLNTAGSGRLELANWIASRENPLTARVIVNRVWQGHFGEGLVRSPNNFGMQSQPPSHPALLDWLASRLKDDGWSLKHLHRRIMLSATYQQASRVPGAHAERDPENRLLGRLAARRLDAEEIRDAMLSAAGRLDPAPGGPAGADVATPRRSLYVQTARWDRSSFATLFDGANPDASEGVRQLSTVAPQALFLLNNPLSIDLARDLAERVLRECPDDRDARIARACELLFGRPARAEEIEICRGLVGSSDNVESWTDLAHVLLCSNEFIYLD